MRTKLFSCFLLLLFLCSCTYAPVDPAETLIEPTDTPAAAPVLKTGTIVQKSDAVALDYFENAVFVGDSRTIGITEFDVLPNTTVLASVSLTVNDLDLKKIVERNEEKLTVMEALNERQWDEIYICFGFNELGYSYPEIFIERYEKAIDAIQAAHPDTPILISLLFPVSRKHEEKEDEYENNERIAQYNEMILEMAKRKGLLILDYSAEVSDEDGFLKPEYTDDGTHLNPDGYAIWLDYITTHSWEGNME